jgi:hypothetical protein
MPACFEPLCHCPLDVANRGQVMGQQFGLAFDEIGASQRRNTEVRLTHRWRGESGANPSPKLGLFRAILDGNKLVFGAENHEESQLWLVIAWRVPLLSDCENAHF